MYGQLRHCVLVRVSGRWSYVRVLHAGYMVTPSKQWVSFFSRKVLMHVFLVFQRYEYNVDRSNYHPKYIETPTIHLFYDNANVYAILQSPLALYFSSLPGIPVSRPVTGY